MEHESAWDWTADIWGWSPDQGRWSPAHGRPDTCVSVRLSTLSVPAREAWDYWQETVIYGFDAHRPAADRTDAFQADIAALIAPHAELYDYRSDAMAGQRTDRHCRQQSGNEMIDLALVLAGRRMHHQASDRVQNGSPGDIVVHDAAHPASLAWEDYHGLHLTLPRTAVRHALGCKELPGAGDLARIWQQSPLFPFLRAELGTLARHGASLQGPQQALVLDIVVELALAAMRSVESGQASDRDPEALVLSAQRLIQRRLADPHLNAESLARLLGVSRATLYRAFAEQQRTVGGYLREARLQRAYHMLQRAPAAISIGEIAAQCGMLDNAAFSRAFRQRFGLRPTDVRALK